MPGLYAPGDFDLAGFIVGSVAREKILDGSRVRPGQKILAMRSSGLHTNGYSLARRVLFDKLKLEIGDRPRELGGPSVGEALLGDPPPVPEPALAAARAGPAGGAGAHHRRGTGRQRAARAGPLRRLDRPARAGRPPALFRYLCEQGDVAPDESYQVFNMGIGMVLFVDPAHERDVRASLEARGEEVLEIGRTEEAQGPEGVVRWSH